MSSVKATGRGAAALCPVCACAYFKSFLFHKVSINRTHFLNMKMEARIATQVRGKINPGCGAEDAVVVAASGSPVGRSAPVPVLSQSPGGSHCRPEFEAPQGISPPTQRALSPPTSKWTWWGAAPGMFPIWFSTSRLYRKLMFFPSKAM